MSKKAHVFNSEAVPADAPVVADQPVTPQALYDQHRAGVRDLPGLDASRKNYALSVLDAFAQALGLTVPAE